MSTTGWIILAVVIVVVLLLALAVWRSMRRKRMAEQASEIRAEAREHAVEVGQTRRDSREAELRAEQVRLEAERAEREAEIKRQALAQEEAAHEDRLREADRLDPEVDHKADDYQPSLRARSERDEGTVEAEDAAREDPSAGGQHRR